MFSIGHLPANDDDYRKNTGPVLITFHTGKTETETYHK